MSLLKISRFDMPYEVMLILQHSTGVAYENQVGGVICWQAELEGVLAPVELGPNSVERIMNLSYQARRGITAELADGIDEVLAATPGGRYLKVDRDRLDESWEAWVFVVVDSPVSTVHDLTGPYFGAPRGFGATRGVLTWPNSD
jgi:hypothetical protein